MTEVRLACLRAIISIATAGVVSAGSLPSVSITTKSLPFGAVGAGYSAQMNATGGTGGYQWAVTQGSLPPGLVMSPSGAITGNPSAGGSFQFVVTVQDPKAQDSDSKPFTIGILQISTPSPLPSGTTANFYTLTFNASDGPPGTYVWSIDTPPGGLSMSNTGTLSGNPATAGNFSFTVSVTVTTQPGIAAGQSLSASKAFVLTIGSGITISTPTPLPPGDVNSTYRTSLSVVAGRFPFAWGISAGALPNGLSIVFDSGIIQGTPTSTGTSNFTVQVQDIAQNIATKAFSITINSAPQITTASPLPSGLTGTPYTQLFSATGGTPPYIFFIDTPPPGLTINTSGVLSGTPTSAGTFSFNIAVTDAANARVTKAFQVVIGSTAPQVQVTPQSLTFSGAPGGDAPPAQSIVVLAAGGSASTFRVVIDSGTAGSAPPPWLTVTPLGGATPARLLVRINQGSMPAGSSSGRIRVIDSSNNATDIPVSLVLSGGTPQLDVIPNVLRFAARIQSPGTLEQILVVRNIGGGGALSFTTSLLGASPWVTDITPNSGRTAPNAPVFLRVHVNTQGLKVGSYRDVIRVSSSAGNIDVPVLLFVANSGSILSVDVAGIRFQSRQGGGYSNTQTINVLNIGDPGTTANWTASVTSNADNFILLGATSGTATPGNPGKLPVTLNANASQLAPGAYYAMIRIADSRSLNSPQHVMLVLDQSSNNSTALPDPSPAGMFFTAAAGGSAPAQVITVNTSSATPVAFQAASSTSDGGNWVNVSPANGTSTGSAPGQITVSVNVTGLAPGIYSGEVDISMSGVVRTVTSTLVVRPAGTVAALEGEPAAGCTPAKLALTQTGLINNFSVPAKWPAALIVQLNDDCGGVVTNGSVVASFSNSDSPLTLRGDGQSGTYSATWQSGTVTPQMVVTLQAVAGSLQPATVQLTGAVTQNQAPVLAKGGTVNAFHRTAAALAPGTVAEVYGTGLAAGTVSTGAPPLPTQSNGTVVLVGGISAPLFFLSTGQLDVQIPSELAASQQYVVIVSANGALTLPDVIDVVPMQPGISAFADGHIIAQHVDGSLVDAARPAKPGEAIVTYALAMGPTNPSVPSGSPSPALPLAVVVNQPTVSVEGQNAQVLFAGLTPTYAGLYQINFVVPSTARSGDLTVLVTQNGIASNATKMPVQ